MNLSHLEQNLRPLEVEFAGETLKFSYKPAAATPAFYDGLGAEKQPLVWALSKVLVSWDLVDDQAPTPNPYNAPTVPLTEQRLMELPVPFLRTVFRAILDDLSVGEPFGAPSKNG